MVLKRRGLLTEPATQLLEVGLATLASGHNLAVEDGALHRKAGRASRMAANSTVQSKPFRE